MTYTNKTQPTTITPEAYLKALAPKNKQVLEDARALIAVYTKATGSPCVMWNKIFGFGSYEYADSKGGMHTHLMTGFAISSTGFTLYTMVGWKEYEQEIKKLGVYKLSGKSCLAIKNVAAIDLAVLGAIIKKSIAVMKKKYKTHK